MTTWQPVIAALAVLIVAVTPSLAALLVGLANRASLKTVQGHTDGQLTALKAEIAALRTAHGETPAPLP